MPETQAALNAFESVNVPDLVGVVEERLTQAIVQGRLPPGSRVVEAEIARQMAISRAPVREASRRLERQGILVSRPRRGFFVREMSVREIDDLFQVRLSLEMTAVAAACEHADAAGLASARLAGTDDRRGRRRAAASPHRAGPELPYPDLRAVGQRLPAAPVLQHADRDAHDHLADRQRLPGSGNGRGHAPAHPGRAGAPRCTGRAGLHEGTSGRCLGARPQPVRLAAWRGGRKPRAAGKHESRLQR